MYQILQTKDVGQYYQDGTWGLSHPNVGPTPGDAIDVVRDLWRPVPKSSVQVSQATSDVEHSLYV